MFIRVNLWLFTYQLSLNQRQIDLVTPFRCFWNCCGGAIFLDQRTCLDGGRQVDRRAFLGLLASISRSIDGECVGSKRRHRPTDTHAVGILIEAVTVAIPEGREGTGCGLTHAAGGADKDVVAVATEAVGAADTVGEIGDQVEITSGAVDPDIPEIFGIDAQSDIAAIEIEFPAPSGRLAQAGGSEGDEIAVIATEWVAAGIGHFEGRIGADQQPIIGQTGDTIDILVGGIQPDIAAIQHPREGARGRLTGGGGGEADDVMPGDGPDIGQAEVAGEAEQERAIALQMEGIDLVGHAQIRAIEVD